MIESFLKYKTQDEINTKQLEDKEEVIKLCAAIGGEKELTSTLKTSLSLGV